MKALLFVLPSALLLGCGDGGTPASTRKDASVTDARASDSGADVRRDGSLDRKRDAGDAGEASAPGDGGKDVTDVPFDASPYVPLDGGHAPLVDVPSEQWAWVPFPETRCRDGSSTGLGVNFNPASDKVVIFLEGGGACFNPTSCVLNPANFGAADLPAVVASVPPDAGGEHPGSGLLDRTNPDNAVHDWNFVYVPYCSGDVFAGNNPHAEVPGVAGTQVFLGYQDLDLFLQRIVPTFPHATQVLLVGVSGGGFGAAANYLHVKRAFGGAVPVDMIDDSGPFMQSPYLPACLFDQIRTLWALDSTAGADCDGACNDPDSFFLDLVKHAIATNPERTFGLVESTWDLTISDFFGFGTDDCQLSARESQSLFTGGLLDIRAQLADAPNFGSFYFEGDDHTSLEAPIYYTRSAPSEAGTVKLTSWVASQVAGHATAAGP